MTNDTIVLANEGLLQLEWMSQLNLLLSILIFILCGCHLDEQFNYVPSDEQASFISERDKKNGPKEEEGPVPIPTQTPIPEVENSEGKQFGIKKLIIGNKVNKKGKMTDDPGYFQEGLWWQSSLPGYKNSISRYSDDSYAKVKYETDKLGGRYCLSVYRVAHPNSTRHAHYKLKVENDLAPLLDLEVNQALPTHNSGWLSIGIININYLKRVSLELTFGNQNVDGYLRADEIRFYRLDEDTDCEGKIYKKINVKGVIDNKNDVNLTSNIKKDDDGYREEGIWQQSSLLGFNNTISRYSSDPSAFVSYTAKVGGGTYCLQLFRMAHPNSSKNVKIEFFKNENQLTSLVQKVDLSLPSLQTGWINLGDKNFNTNDLVKLKISNSAPGSGFLRADAVRFIRDICH